MKSHKAMCLIPVVTREYPVYSKLRMFVPPAFYRKPRFLWETSYAAQLWSGASTGKHFAWNSVIAVSEFFMGMRSESREHQEHQGPDKVKSSFDLSYWGLFFIFLPVHQPKKQAQK